MDENPLPNLNLPTSNFVLNRKNFSGAIIMEWVSECMSKQSKERVLIDLTNFFRKFLHYFEQAEG